MKRFAKAGILLGGFSLLNVYSPADAKTTRKTSEKKNPPVAEERGAVEEADEVSEDGESIPKVTSSGKKVIVRKAGEVESEMSEVKREGLKVEIMLDIIGFTPSPTSGVYVGYYFSPSQILNFRYGTASGVFSSMDEKLTTIGLKSFWGNTFYTNIGLSKRDYSFEWDLDVVDAEGNLTFDSYRAAADTSSMGLEIHIGNQWQWKHYTMGVDWIGSYIPLSSSGPKELDTHGVLVDSSMLPNVDRDVKYAATSQVAFLRLFLGFAF